MAEGTIRKSRVSFRIVGSGEFVVEHEDGESPTDVLKELVAEKKLGLVDLYLHGDEFEWKLEATDAMVYVPVTEDGTTPIIVIWGGGGGGGIGASDDESSYPPELGGGPITEVGKTLTCGCGRVYPMVDAFACVCGRTSEQFERPL